MLRSVRLLRIRTPALLRDFARKNAMGSARSSHPGGGSPLANNVFASSMGLDPSSGKTLARVPHNRPCVAIFCPTRRPPNRPEIGPIRSAARLSCRAGLRHKCALGTLLHSVKVSVPFAFCSCWLNRFRSGLRLAHVAIFDLLVARTSPDARSALHRVASSHCVPRFPPLFHIARARSRARTRATLLALLPSRHRSTSTACSRSVPAGR